MVACGGEQYLFLPLLLHESDFFALDYVPFSFHTPVCIYYLILLTLLCAVPFHSSIFLHWRHRIYQYHGLEGVLFSRRGSYFLLFMWNQADINTFFLIVFHLMFVCVSFLCFSFHLFQHSSISSQPGIPALTNQFTII